MRDSGNIAGSLILGAVGAILYFAVTAEVQGVELSTVGVILMALGAIGLIISMFVSLAPRHTERRVEERNGATGREVHEEQVVR